MNTCMNSGVQKCLLGGGGTKVSCLLSSVLSDGSSKPNALRCVLLRATGLAGTSARVTDSWGHILEIYDAAADR